MALTRTIESSFNAGELSPRAAGRVDQARYFNGGKTFENFLPLVPGGARTRGGLKFAGYTKFTGLKAYLTPFVFSQKVVYMLEWGHLYIRFWVYDANGEPTLLTSAGVPVEVVTPYTETEVAEIDVKQSADVLFIDHPAHPPAMLSRVTSTSFIYTVIGFIPPPTYEAKLMPATTLVSSAATGLAVTLTAGSAAFLPADVGRQIGTVDTSLAIIASYISATQVTADIIQGSFRTGASTYASGEWWLLGSPNATLQVYVGGPVGTKTTFYTYSDTTGATPVAAFRPDDVGKYIVVLGGVAQIFGFFDSHTVFVTILTALTKFPVPQQVAVIDPATLTVTLKTPASVPAFVLAGLWTLESPTWTAARGYPSAITLGQQRVFHAGAAAEPDTIRATPTGDYFGFNPGAEDDRALAFTVASDEVNLVQWLAFTPRGLAVGTLGGGFLVQGASGGLSPLTPRATMPVPSSMIGSEKANAVRVGTALIYIERGARHVRELLYDVSGDGYIPHDMLFWSDHLTEQFFFRGVVYQKSKYPLLWFPRCDGIFVSCTYTKEEQVLGWARHVTATKAGNSYILSLAVGPNPVKSLDDLWAIVIRTINGQEVRTVEVLDWDRRLDCSLTYSGPAVATLTGLSHLEGETVYIVGTGADGILRLYPPQTVVSGQVTGLNPQVISAEVGILFVGTLTTMRLEIRGPGTLQGRVKSYGQAAVRTVNTPSLKIQGFRYPAGWYDPAASVAMPANPLSDATLERDTLVSPIGVDTDARVTWVQDLPLPTELLLFTAEVEVGH